MTLNQLLSKSPGPMVAVSSEQYWRAFVEIQRGYASGEFHLLSDSTVVAAVGLQILGPELATVHMDTRPPFVAWQPCRARALIPVTLGLGDASADPRFVACVCWTCRKLTMSFTVTTHGTHVVCSDDPECRRVGDAVLVLKANRSSWPFCQISFRSAVDERPLVVPVPMGPLILCNVPLPCTLFLGLTEEQATNCSHQLQTFARELLQAEIRSAACIPPGIRSRASPCSSKSDSSD